MSAPRKVSRCGDSASQPRAPFAVEPTSIGPQSLIPGVAPITPLDRLLQRAAAPLEPKKPQRACDCGLFDLNARNQLNLFAASQRADDVSRRRGLEAEMPKEL